MSCTPVWLGIPMLCVAVSTCLAAGLYVSPEGDDAWSGRSAERAGEDGPFATLARAQDEARKLSAAGEPVTVLVRGGLYELGATFALGAEDSGTPEAPVVYRAYGDEKPILAGAKQITGFKPWKGDILQADLKGTPLEGVVFRQLFFDGARMEMARYPNEDLADPHFGEWAYVLATDAAPATNRSVSDNIARAKDHFTATEDVIKDWTHVDRAEVCIHPAYGWAWNIVPIKSADTETGEITLAKPVSYGLMVGDRYFVRNLLEELDAPGEWYLDRDTSTLYFYPPGDVTKSPVLAPVVGTLVHMKGAANITVRGFTIEACDGDAVRLEECEGCLIAASTIRNCGAWAVSISGGRNCGAQGNDIYYTGAGGVNIRSGDRAALTPAGCYADNNYIHHIAEFQRTYNTGVNLNGVGNRASHNLIHDCYHQAILMGGNDHVVEYNIVHHTNLGSEDTGGLYMSSRDYTQRGSIIRYNIFHHCGGFGKSNSWQPVRNGKVQFHYPGFTWGIYLDAPEVGMTVFGNVLYDVPVCGMFNHEGRDNTWENNIVVNAPGFQISSGGYPDLDELSYSYIKKLREQGGYDAYRARYPELDTYTDDKATHHTCAPGKFVRNIIYYTDDPGKYNAERRKGWNGQLVYTFRGSKASFEGFSFEENCIYGPPDLDLKFSLTGPSLKTGMLTWDEWRETGQDQRSVLADPLFVDPASHDYRLKPDSPALKLGFKQIPMDEIGPYEHELRASWPVVEAPGAAALGDFTTERYFELPGHEPVAAFDVAPRSGAPNLLAKLRAGEPVTVACFAGGNHAQGGWLDQVVDGLRAAYPQSEITPVDASICGCARGIGFSVYRFAHDVLQKKPDAVFIDFAADDAETGAEAIWTAGEGVIRQSLAALPKTDVVLVYAFRPDYEQAYKEGVCPTAVSAWDRLAEHYGLPAINMGYRIAQMGQRGELVVKATPEEAQKLGGKPVFTHDGTYASADAKKLYAEAILDGLKRLEGIGAPGDRALSKAFHGDNLQAAKLVPVTQAMLSGEWERTPAQVTSKDFGRHFDAIWVTKKPGAKLSFRFRGTEASLFSLLGPDLGQVRVTVDGQDRGIRGQLDRWSYYHRLSGIPLASGLSDAEHAVTVELLAEAPDRSVATDEAKRLGQFKAEDFEGVTLRVGWIRVVGEVLE